MTLTTEQLIARAESLGLDFFIERRAGIWVKEWFDNGCTSATAEEVMMWSMLANREAQPAGFYTTVSGRKGVVWHNGAPEDDTAIFTAPPAPAVPPEKKLPELMMASYHEAIGWNACRAAMLDQPVSSGYKLPDGWIACSERMPEPNKYVQVSNGVWVGIGEYNDSEQFEFDERWQDEHGEFIDLLHHPVTHWMPLPSLPQEA